MSNFENFENLQDEIDAMDAPSQEENVEVEEEELEESTVSEDVTDEHEQEEESNEEVEEDGEEETEESDSEEESDELEGEEDLKDTEIEESETQEEEDTKVNTETALRLEIERLTGLIAEKGISTKSKETVEDPPKDNEDDSDYDYAGDFDIDDIAADRNTFNKVMSMIEKRVIEKASQKTLMDIPQVVLHHIKQQQMINKVVDRFYEENNDLKDLRQTVGHVANQTSVEHPDWNVSKIFNEAAKRTRKLLKLPVPVKKVKRKLETDPKKVRSKAPIKQRKVTKSKISKLQREIDEL